MFTKKQLTSALHVNEVTTALRSRVRGLEKESLRITSDGKLAQTPHPTSLGSALTNGSITTDFSESLLEFITKPHPSIKEALAELENVHAFTYRNLKDELLWVGSMPCILVDEEHIPIAQYGSSNVAKMKSAYRVGLANRYGKAMQTIAGIHFNFSLSDDFFQSFQQSLGQSGDLQTFKTERYFSLIRNFHRYSWLLLYLFGASPAVCKSFLQGRSHNLSALTEGTLVGEYSTALRMGDLGYTSNAQENLFVCYNRLDSYINSLYAALTKDFPAFKAMGLKDGQGDYKQLSTAILQIENEYYSTIRPKRTAESGETPIKALKERGVEYVEVRCLDLNPFLPMGTCEQDLQFVELFLIYCLVAGDDALNVFGLKESKANMRRVINNGRLPGLTLLSDSKEISFHDWSNTLLDEMAVIADRLKASGDHSFDGVVERYRERISDPSLTPSGKIYKQLTDDKTGFAAFGVRASVAVQQYFTTNAVNEDEMAMLAKKAAHSIKLQQAIENQDTVSFEQYLADYFEQYSELKHESIANA